MGKKVGMNFSQIFCAMPVESMKFWFCKFVLELGLCMNVWFSSTYQVSSYYHSVPQIHPPFCNFSFSTKCGGGGLMHGIKIPLQDFALKCRGGLCTRGGHICGTLWYMFLR